MRRTFDFSLLPPIDYQGMLIQLDKEVEQAFLEISQLQETYDRARAALMFFFLTNDKADRWRNDAYIRAGLNELYSMQDSVARAFKSSGMGRHSPKISDSRHPLVHIMYILRHINVHTVPLPSKIEETTVIYRPKTVAEEMTYDIVVLSDITLEDLLKSKEVKDHYNRPDLVRACEWLMEKQRAFGIAEVFSKGVDAYCAEVISTYRKQ